MSHRISPWSLLLWLGIGAVAVGGCRRVPELSEEDRLARQDDKGAEPKPSPPEPELFPDTETGRKLREHMLILALPSATPADADRRYAGSLAELRKSSKDALALLSQAYRDIPPSRYYDRWALVKTMADLEVPDAYQGLAAVARSPLPPEQNKDTHHFSTQEEEIMIRIRAVDGLGKLAAKGHQGADKDLLTLATDSTAGANLAIQARAIKAYLRAGKDYNARARLLKSRLPPERHGLVTLNVTPQTEFEKRVSALATVSDSISTGDSAEEGLPPARSPVAAPTKR